MKLLGKFIFVVPFNSGETKTASGLIVPSSSVGENRGRVVAIGDISPLEHGRLSLGDTVAWGKYKDAKPGIPPEELANYCNISIEDARKAKKIYETNICRIKKG